MEKIKQDRLDLLASDDPMRGPIQNIVIQDVNGIMSFIATSGHVLSIVPLSRFKTFTYPEDIQKIKGKLILPRVWKDIVQPGCKTIFELDKIKCENITYPYATNPIAFPEVLKVLPDLNSKPDFVLSFNTRYLNTIVKAAGRECAQIVVYGNKIVVRPHSGSVTDKHKESFNMLMGCRLSDIPDNEITKSIKKYQKGEAG